MLEKRKEIQARVILSQQQQAISDLDEDQTSQMYFCVVKLANMQTTLPQQLYLYVHADRKTCMSLFLCNCVGVFVYLQICRQANMRNSFSQ